MAIQNINDLYDRLSEAEEFSSLGYKNAEDFKTSLSSMSPEDKKDFYDIVIAPIGVNETDFDGMVKKKETGRTGILSSALGSIDFGSPSVSKSEPQAVVTETENVSGQMPIAPATTDVVGPQDIEMGIEDSSVSGVTGGPLASGPGPVKPTPVKKEEPLIKPASQLQGRTFDIGQADEQFAGQKKQIEEKGKEVAKEIAKKAAMLPAAREVIKPVQEQASLIKMLEDQNDFKRNEFVFETPSPQTEMDATGNVYRPMIKTAARPTDEQIGEILYNKERVLLSNPMDIGRWTGPTQHFDEETFEAYLKNKGLSPRNAKIVIQNYINKYLDSKVEDVDFKLSKVEGKTTAEKINKIREQENEYGLDLLTRQYGISVGDKARELQTYMANRKRPGEAGYEQWNKQLGILQKEMSGLVGGGQRLYNPEDGKLYDRASAPKRALVFKAYLDDAIKVYKNTDVDKLKEIRSNLMDKVKFLEEDYDRKLGPQWRGKGWLKSLSGTMTDDQEEALKNSFATLDKYKAQLSAINSRLLTNTDIEPITTDKTGQFAKQLKAALPGGDFQTQYRTLKDNYGAYVDAVDGVIQLKPEEIEKRELTVGEEAIGAIGSSIPIMVEIIASRSIAPAVEAIRASRYLRPITRGALKLTGNRKFANFVSDMVASAAHGYITYAPTSETGATGVGETLFSEGIYDKVGLNKLGAQWNPVFRYLSKVAFGTLGETAEEFVGEYTNALSETGFDFAQSAEETFGKNVSDFSKKLAVYAASSAVMSSAFNTPELFIKATRFDDVRKLAEEKLQNPNISQDEKETIESSLKMMDSTKQNLDQKEAEEPVNTIDIEASPTEVAAMETFEGAPETKPTAEVIPGEEGVGPIEATPEAVGPQTKTNLQEISTEVAQGGVTDVSLQKIEDYGKEIESGNVDFERFSPAEQRGLIEGGPIHVEATVITGKSDRGTDTQDDSNDRQEEIIKEYAQKKGIWMENAPAKLAEKYGDIFESGKESLVWLDKARGVVIKSSVTNQYPTLREALDSITLSNAYFPAAKISVIGFGTNKDGDFEIITEQPYIQGVNPTEQEIKDYFNKLGFTENEKLYQGKDAFGNEEVIFKDAARKNVIKTPEGNIIPIDLIAKINKPELNANGTRTVPSTVAEEAAPAKVAPTEAAPEAVGPQAEADIEAKKADIEQRRQKELEDTGVADIDKETIEEKTLREITALFEKYKDSKDSGIEFYVAEQKRTGALDDRAYATLANKYFEELSDDVRNYLEFKAPAIDFETPEGYSPYYKGFGYNRDKATGHTPQVHGGHISLLKENISQDNLEKANKQDLAEDINAKYDAELTALEQKPTEAVGPQAEVTTEEKPKEAIELTQEKQIENRESVANNETEVETVSKVSGLLSKANKEKFENLKNIIIFENGKFEEQAESGEPKQEPSLEQVRTRAIQENKNKFIKAIANISRRAIEKKAVGTLLTKADAKDIKSFAEENGFFYPSYEDIAKNRKPLKPGVESLVYVDADGRSVIKINNGIYNETWGDFFNRIAAHNIYFPETQYEFLGFTERDGRLAVIVKQPLVDTQKGATPNEVKADLAKRGLEFKSIYNVTDKQNDVTLRDFHNENAVFDNSGNIAYIDPIIEVKGDTLFRNYIGVLYAASKAQNINPELVKAIEEAIGEEIAPTEEKPNIIEFIENGKPVKVDLNKLELVPIEDDFIYTGFSIESEGTKLGEISIRKSGDNIKIVSSQIFSSDEEALATDKEAERYLSDLKFYYNYKDSESEYKFIELLFRKLRAAYYKILKGFKGKVIYDTNQGKGIGKKAYGILAKVVKDQFNTTLISDTQRSEASEALWKSLERDGLAVNRGEYYEYILPAEGYGSQNKIVTKSDYDQAIKNLRNPNIPSGFDFSKLGDLIKAGMYHIEAGSRKFADFTKKMIEQFGQRVRPYLVNVFKKANTQLQQQQAAAPEVTPTPGATVTEEGYQEPLAYMEDSDPKKKQKVDQIASQIVDNARKNKDILKDYDDLTKKNYTLTRIGVELQKKGYTLGQIKKNLPDMAEFWETAAVTDFVNDRKRFGNRIKERQAAILKAMENNPGGTYQQYYEQLKSEYGDTELYRAFYYDGATDVELEEMFGSDYRQTIQKAMKSDGTNPDLLRTLRDDARIRKINDRLNEQSEIFAELQDFGTAEESLAYMAQGLFESGALVAMETVTNKLRSLNEERAASQMEEEAISPDSITKEMLEKKLALDEKIGLMQKIVKGEVPADTLINVSELLSFSGRMLRMGRDLFKTPKGLSDMIIKSLENVTIKREIDGRITKKKLFSLTQNQKGKIEILAKTYLDTQKIYKDAVKELEDSSQAYRNEIWDKHDKAKKEFLRASKYLKSYVGLLRSQRKGGKFTDWFTSMTTLGLLSLRTITVGLISNVEMRLSTSGIYISTKLGKFRILGWSRMLADFLVRKSVNSETSSIANEVTQRGVGSTIDATTYRKMAMREGINQIAQILADGNFDSSTSQNEFLMGYNSNDSIKDLGMGFKMLNTMVKRYFNKEGEMSAEEWADAFDRLLVDMNRKDANGKPVVALQNSKAYEITTALLRGIFGAVPTGIGRLISLSGDRVFFKLGYYEFLASYANAKGITDPVEIERFIRLNSVPNSETDIAARKSGDRGIFQADNYVTKALIGGARRYLNKKADEIYAKKIAAQQKELSKKQIRARAVNSFAKSLLTGFSPFVRIPSNVIHIAMKKSIFVYSGIFYLIEDARLKEMLAEYSEKYDLQKNPDLTAAQIQAMEKMRLKIFEQQRKTVDALRDTMQAIQVGIIVGTLIASGAVTPPYGEDDEERNRALASGKAKVPPGSINFTHLRLWLSGKDVRYRTAQDGDVIESYQNAGLIGLGLSWGSAFSTKLFSMVNKNEKEVGAASDISNAVSFGLVTESVTNGITGLSFIQTVGNFLNAFKSEQAKETFLVGLTKTALTVPTMSYGAFGFVDRARGMSLDPLRGYEGEKEKGEGAIPFVSDFLNSRYAAKVWQGITGKSPFTWFGLKNEKGEFISPLASEYFQPQIGPFGEELYKKSTFFDIRSDDPMDKVMAYIQAGLDPFSFNTYEGFVSSVRDYSKDVEYDKGDFVIYNNLVYAAKDKVKGSNPYDDSKNWEFVDKKTDFFDVKKFMQNKRGEERTKQLYDLALIYEKATGEPTSFGLLNKIQDNSITMRDNEGELKIYVPAKEMRELQKKLGQASLDAFSDTEIPSLIERINRVMDQEPDEEKAKKQVENIVRETFEGNIGPDSKRRNGIKDKINDAQKKVEETEAYKNLQRNAIKHAIENGLVTEEQYLRLLRSKEFGSTVSSYRRENVKFRK